VDQNYVPTRALLLIGGAASSQIYRERLAAIEFVFARCEKPAAAAAAAVTRIFLPLRGVI
jgi:hypothetical protein